MRLPRDTGVYLGLVLASVLLLVLEYHTGAEFLFHLAAIPLEVLVAVLIVERMLERRAAKERRRQLMFIKSHVFRADMRDLFLANFRGLSRPAISLRQVQAASLDQLVIMRRQAERVEYRSAAAAEEVIEEYVKAQPVWSGFMERAITHSFEDVFHDMIYILHFINDVRSARARCPGSLFAAAAAQDPRLMAKIEKVLGDGIRKFLDYAIELKEKQPTVFADLMADYQAAEQAHAAVQ